jgi:hypothetical protein
MQLWSNNFDINHLIDYHVVDIHYESRITTEWLQRASVTHIRGYCGDSSQFKPCKGINLTTRHMRARRAPRVATVHNAVKKMISDHLTLVHVFHMYASVDTPWVPQEATQFVGPHKISYAPVHNSNLLIGARQLVPNRHRRGLPPWRSEFQIRPLILLPIHYSPFSPNCPVRSPIMPFYQLIMFSTFQSPTRV